MTGCQCSGEPAVPFLVNCQWKKKILSKQAPISILLNFIMRNQTLGYSSQSQIIYHFIMQLCSFVHVVVRLSYSCVRVCVQIFDEVEKRRQISMAMIYPFMQKLREAPFPAPGNTVEINSFIPESGTEVRATHLLLLLLLVLLLLLLLLQFTHCSPLWF